MREISELTRLFGRGLALSFGALLLAGCSEEQPPEAAFGARPVLRTRELGRMLMGFDRTRTKLYLSQVVTRFDVWESGHSCCLSDVFSLDVVSGEETLVAEKVSWFREVASRTGDGPTLFVRQETVAPGAPMTLTLLYGDGTRADFDHVIPSSIGWSDEFLVFIRDEGPGRALWAGPFTAPRLVSGELFAHDWQFIGREQLALTASPATEDLSPEDTGIFRVDLSSGQVSTEFSAEIAAAEWPFAGPPPELASDGLAAVTNVEGIQVATLGGGCWSASEPLAWGAADQRCYLLYTRHMKDATFRAFVGLPDEHREIALPGETPFQFATAGPDVHTIPFSGNAPLAVWTAPKSDASGYVFARWDAANEKFSECELDSDGIEFFAWRPDGSAFTYGEGGKMTFVEAGVTGCFDFVAPQKDNALFSPEGSRLAWAAEQGLWSARGDGREAAARLSGADLQPLRFIDEDRLIALRDSPDGQGLISLDLSETSPDEHPIVEQVFFTGPRLGPRIMASGNSFNVQDRTGTFSLIDLETNAVDVVADSVADYAVGFPSAPGADSFPFAYLRIGRFASQRDGIWVGQISNEYVEER